MKLHFTKLGFKICIIYLLLFIASFILLISGSEESPLIASYALLLTLPWSFIDTFLLYFLGLIDSVPMYYQNLLLVLYASINAIILYFIGYLFDKRKSTKE
jgi:hypothetical protein